MKRIDVWCQRLNSASLTVASVLFVVSFFMTVLQVFTRYVLRFSFPWTEELTRYLITFVVMLASGYLLRNNENPYVEVFAENLSGRKKYLLTMVIYGLITVFLIFLLWNGVSSVFKAMNKRTPSLRIRWAIPYLSIPIGAFLMLVQMPYLFVKNRQEHLHSEDDGGDEPRGGR